MLDTCTLILDAHGSRSFKVLSGKKTFTVKNSEYKMYFLCEGKFSNDIKSMLGIPSIANENVVLMTTHNSLIKNLYSAEFSYMGSIANLAYELKKEIQIYDNKTVQEHYLYESREAYFDNPSKYGAMEIMFEFCISYCENGVVRDFIRHTAPISIRCDSLLQQIDKGAITFFPNDTVITMKPAIISTTTKHDKVTRIPLSIVLNDILPNIKLPIAYHKVSQFFYNYNGENKETLSFFFNHNSKLCCKIKEHRHIILNNIDNNFALLKIKSNFLAMASEIRSSIVLSRDKIEILMEDQGISLYIPDITKISQFCYNGDESIKNHTLSFFLDHNAELCCKIKGHAPISLLLDSTNYNDTLSMIKSNFFSMIVNNIQQEIQIDDIEKKALMQHSDILRYVLGVHEHGFVFDNAARQEQLCECGKKYELRMPNNMNIIWDACRTLGESDSTSNYELVSSCYGNYIHFIENRFNISEPYTIEVAMHILDAVKNSCWLKVFFCAPQDFTNDAVENLITAPKRTCFLIHDDKHFLIGVAADHKISFLTHAQKNTRCYNSFQKIIHTCACDSGNENTTVNHHDRDCGVVAIELMLTILSTRNDEDFLEKLHNHALKKVTRSNMQKTFQETRHKHMVMLKDNEDNEENKFDDTSFVQDVSTYGTEDFNYTDVCVTDCNNVLNISEMK